MPPGHIAVGDPTAAPADGSGAERVLTRPLAWFLAFVAAVVGWQLWQRHAPRGIAAAVRELADGDADAEERDALLRGVLAAAPAATDAAARWAVLLAAIALEDGAAHANALARLRGADGALELPPPGERQWLHLGDPALGNVFAAAVAEAAGDRAGARARWQLVETQSRLSRRLLAEQLAHAAVERLR